MREKLSDPGWTPGRKDFASLVALLDDDEVGEDAVRALARAGLPGAIAALDAVTPGRIAAIGRVARSEGDERLIGALASAIAHEDPRVRKAAIVACGKIRSSVLESTLVARYEKASEIDRRAIVVSLGKTGGKRALDLIASIGADDKQTTRAKLVLERTVSREEGAIDLDSMLPRPCTIVWRCRRGLEAFHEEEVKGEIRAREVAKRARTTLRAALESRIAIDVAIEIARDAEIEDILARPDVIEILRAWTKGQVRFRLELEVGRKRALLWELAEKISKKTSAIVNDPTRASWDVIVHARRLLLVPKAFDDPRFSYRVRDVPASSHPTIAAALAHVAGARAHEIVWDPFVGSGLELVERSRIGPWTRMIGTDTSEDALEAARENLERAGVRADLILADARTHALSDVTLAITNPPMGRRIARDRSLRILLDDVLANMRRALAPSARIVWLSPLPEETAKRGASLGLDVERGPLVDIGGFDAELQIMRTRALTETSSRRGRPRSR